MNILQIAKNHAGEFTEEFLNWLPKNLHVWEEFQQRATGLWFAGHRSYSSKTIVHVMRYHSDIQEVGTRYKISNNTTPYLSRLWAFAHPDMADMFRTKELSNRTAKVA